MKTILVTGGAGFIGSSFIRLVAKKNLKIIVVDKLTYAGDLRRLEAVKSSIKFYKTDVCNDKAIKEIFKKYRPEGVVHFAAETHVDRSIMESGTFLKTNIQGTQVLLDSAKKYGVSKFVHISTDEVYGEIRRGQFLESTPLDPNSPYSAAKAAADLLVQSYVRTFSLPAVIVRPSNNYGPWQYPEKFVPVIVYKAIKDQRIPVYARGLNVREWLYVDDCAAAVFKVLRKGRVGEVYNVGSGMERKNIEVVKAILSIIDKPRKLIEFVKDRPGHDFRYSLNCKKIRNELGWRPRMDLACGLNTTVHWYQENFKWLNQKASRLKDYWKKNYKKA